MGLDIYLYGSKLGVLDRRYRVRSDLRNLARVILELVRDDMPEAQRLNHKYQLHQLDNCIAYDDEYETPVAESPECWMPPAQVLKLYESIWAALRRRDPDAVAMVEKIRIGTEKLSGWNIGYDDALRDCEDVVELCRQALNDGEEHLTHVFSW